MKESAIFELRKNRSFTNVISETFTFFRQNFKPLSQIYIRKVLPYFVFSILSVSFFGAITYLEVVEISSMAYQSITFVVMLLVGIAFALGFSALIATTLEYMHVYEKNNGITTVEEVWKRASSQLGWLIAAYIGKSFLFLIILFLMMLTNFIGLGIFSSIFFMPIIVYVWVGTSIMFATHFIEEVGFFDSLERSFSLIKNNWWQTFGLWFLLGLIFFSFSIVSQMILNILTFSGAMLGLNSSVFIIVGVVVMVLFSIFSIFFSYLAYALYTIAEGLWYYSLVEQKHAISLEKKIDSIGE